MPAVWAGVDSGKRTHHCVVINQIGMVLLSRRVNNDEAELLELIGAVVDLADGDQVCWATDLKAGGAALLITLLAAHSQRLLYIPGRVVHHAAATYQGSGRPTPRTPGSLPTRRGCGPIYSRFAMRTRSASICGCSPRVVPT